MLRLRKAIDSTVSGTGNNRQRRSSKGRTRDPRPIAPATSPSSVRPTSATTSAVDARRGNLIRLLAGAAAIAVVGALILVGFNILGGDDNNSADDAIVIPTSLTSGAGAASPAVDSTSEAAEGATEQTPGTSTDTASDSGHVLGSADAPVTVVEWADYQCPFCGDFAREVKPQLVEKYVDTGMVKFEFRDFAFLGDQSASDESVNAAEAAWCAGDQGSFWEYHDTLFANQNGENDGAFANARLIEMARQLNLDVASFENCLGRNTHESTIIASRAEADASGINQTPTFFINSEKVVGLKDFEQLSEYIDDALNN